MIRVDILHHEIKSRATALAYENSYSPIPSSLIGRDDKFATHETGGTKTANERSGPMVY
jgi:hypothetical protein